MNPMRFVFPALLAASLAGSAWAQPAPIAVTEAWSRASTPSAQTGAIYVTVTAAEPDRLTAASTPYATKAEVHESTVTNGVVEMRPVPGGLPVTPGAPIHMAPGGYHIMLLGLKQPLKQGEQVPVTLTFEHAGRVTVQADVAGPGASTPPARALSTREPSPKVPAATQ
jgi:copper(I)-binding protein